MAEATQPLLATSYTLRVYRNEKPHELKLMSRTSKEDFAKTLCKSLEFPDRAWSELWAVQRTKPPCWIPLQYLRLKRDFTKFSYDIVWLPGLTEGFRRTVSSWFTLSSDAAELRAMLSKINRDAIPI